MSPPSLPVGFRIHNRYRVIADLGGGVNGQVYEVWDERQNITAALKLLHAAPPGGGLWFEAETLTGLRGDYILPILNADDEAGVPFIVTEVMHHGSTADHIVPDVGVEPARAARWAQQAAMGVARMHDLRLLHADIKPANLFLDREDNVLVGDLGLASRMDAAGCGHAAGSVETMAPEVALALPTTVRSDVYSLGATLYQLLAGHWLNPSLNSLPTAGEQYHAVAHHTPAPLGSVAPHVSRALAAIVMKAVDPDSANRYASAAEFAAALGRRPRDQRLWVRDIPCPGHTTCFSGFRDGTATIKVCAVPATARGRHTIESRRQPAGTRVGLPWPTSTRSSLASTLRARLRQLR